MAAHGRNRHYLFTEIQRRHFNSTAERSGIGKTAEPIINEILTKTPQVIAAVQKATPKGFAQNVLDPILAGLSESAMKLENMAP
jgi:serine/threonine-protein kinase HipA